MYVHMCRSGKINVRTREKNTATHHDTNYTNKWRTNSHTCRRIEHIGSSFELKLCMCAYMCACEWAYTKTCMHIDSGRKCERQGHNCMPHSPRQK